MKNGHNAITAQCRRAPKKIIYHPMSISTYISVVTLLDNKCQARHRTMGRTTCLLYRPTGTLFFYRTISLTVPAPFIKNKGETDLCNINKISHKPWYVFAPGIHSVSFCSQKMHVRHIIKTHQDPSRPIKTSYAPAFRGKYQMTALYCLY
jgi:hypothetical protein